MNNDDLKKYYSNLKLDIQSVLLSEENGGTSEQIFTQIAINILADSGETENATVAFAQRAIGTRNQLQVNAYAFSDNYETLDLFITIYKGSDEFTIISKAEVDTAQKRITNFLKKCINKQYANEIEESSEIFQLANTLSNYKDALDNLLRINIFILTDGEYKGEFPKNEKINDYSCFYKVVDIAYLYKIAEESRVPIEIDFMDFDDEQFQIPCLTTNKVKQKYKTYIAVMPGSALAKLYERYGARLLEQNVRSFLQFTGKVNKGIRETIKREPEMFLAFNNGIAATADHIELDETGRYITKIRNLQIVNGGQTTASIYNSLKKDKSDISKIYVQVKFSIIENPDHYSEIVSRISRYANTQNKVNDADFSANNASLVAFERMSRYVFSPVTETNNMQTCWFFERARGQYKTLRAREGRTPTLQKAFDIKYPKKQVFTKVELAKYINTFSEVYEVKKLVIGPHIVVRGNEKNYALFIAKNLPDKASKINNVYFEDTIAKSILFKTAEQRYGTKANDYNIGELRQVVVPYTLSLINHLTNNKINFYKIWLNQKISSQFSDFIYNLMKEVNRFILENSPGTHYIEWAKKEDCWEKVKSHNWTIDISLIENDLIDENNPPKRPIDNNFEDIEKEQNKSIVRSIPCALWVEIFTWGKENGYFDIVQQKVISSIANKLIKRKPIADEEYAIGIEIINITAKYNEELLQKSEEFINNKCDLKRVKVKIDDEDTGDLILRLIKKMISFNNEKNILKEDEADFLYDLYNDKKERDFDIDAKIVEINKKLEKKGFKV